MALLRPALMSKKSRRWPAQPSTSAFFDIEQPKTDFKVGTTRWSTRLALLVAPRDAEPSECMAL